MFHYSTKPCSGCQRLGTMLRKALTRCRPGLRVQKRPLLAQSGPKRDRLCLSAFGAKRTSAAALSRSSRPLLTRSGHERATFAAMHGRDLYTPMLLTDIASSHGQARSCTTASGGGHSCPHRARTPGASRLRHHVGTSGLSPAMGKG
jgi:hypothetical protein